MLSVVSARFSDPLLATAVLLFNPYRYSSKAHNKNHRYPPALKIFSSPKEVQVALLSTDTSCLKRMPSIGPAAVGP